MALKYPGAESGEAKETDMAVLTPDELAEGRRDVTLRLPGVNYVKPDINAAIQALEDLFETTGRGNARGAITSAMAPFIPTDVQRDAIIAAWLRQKGKREP